MIVLLSPAKSLDFSAPPTTKHYTQPDYLTQSAELIEKLRTLAPQDIASLMKISDSLARLNFQRFADWSLPFTLENAKQAVLAFNGDVYEGLDAEHLTEEDLLFAQKHLRILSGLYGMLRPLDLIQAYRLEMGTRFAQHRGKNLYEFWGMRLTQDLNQQLQADNTIQAVVNCASEEYFKVIQAQHLTKPVITPVFQDWKNGQYKIISFYAKRARGLMARYMIRHRLVDLESLKSFNEEGYVFDEQSSDQHTYFFKRKNID